MCYFNSIQVEKECWVEVFSDRVGRRGVTPPTSFSSRWLRRVSEGVGHVFVDDSVSVQLKSFH